MIRLLSFLFCGILLTTTQAQDTLSYREIIDLPYLSPTATTVDSLQQLNLLLPDEVEEAPLLLWIGGGAWSFTNRNMEMNLARKFARRGVAVAAVGHRVSKGSFSPNRNESGVQHPAHMEDVAAAFKWLYDHAEEYGYDQDNIFVGGYSSGAHLTALLGLDPSYLAAQGLELSHIRGLLPISGTYDIVDYYRVFAEHDNPERRPLADTHVKDVFGADESSFPAASPIHYLDNLQLPMLIVSDRGLYNYTQLFEEKLRETDFQNYQILQIFDLDHGSLWRDLSLSTESVARAAMLSFIRRQQALEKERS